MKGRGIKMKRKSVALLCIVLCQIIFQINVILSNAQEKVDLFEQILIETESKTVEYGLKASFKTEEDIKEVCNCLIGNLGFISDRSKLTVYQKEDSYCVDFSDENLTGYVEGIKCNNEDVITINIMEIDNQNGLKSLKDKVSRATSRFSEDIEYFQYLKAKMGEDVPSVVNNTIYDVNESIIKILKYYGTSNIETVSVNNGLSTVAYTKKYGSKLDNNKVIDFNYAVCNYSSGRYIIIGTPEIITTY